jgi:hypothetical protein
VSRVVFMNFMFDNCTAFNQSLDQWNVSNECYLEHVFNGCHTLKNSPLEKWKAKNEANEELL